MIVLVRKGFRGKSANLTTNADIQHHISDKLPIAAISKTINFLAERVNHGFRDEASTMVKKDVVTINDSDDEEEGKRSRSASEDPKDGADLPKGYQTVPNGLRLYRWEVKPDLRQKLFECLPKDMQEKIEARAEERATVRAFPICLGGFCLLSHSEQARDEAKKLLSAMSKTEQNEILLKGVKGGENGGSSSKLKTFDKGKAKEKVEKKSKATDTDEKTSNKVKTVKLEDNEDGKLLNEKEKSKPGRKAKELTEEEKQQKEEERIKKEQEKAEREKKKAEREAAKAIKDAAKAEKEAIKAEKEAAKAKIEQVRRVTLASR